MSVFYIMLMLPTALKKLTQNQNQNSSVPSVKRVYSKRLLGSILIRARDNWYFTDSGDCA